MNHSFKNIKLKKLAIAVLTVIVLTVTASPFYITEAFAGAKHEYELSYNGIANKADAYINMLGEEMDFIIFCDGEPVTDTSDYTITIGSRTGREIRCKVGTARLDSHGSLWLTTDPDAFFETSVKMYLNTPEGEKVEFGWRKRYGPGYTSDITLARGNDVVPVNSGFGGSSTARMTVRYKGQPVDSFEFMASGKSLGDISSEGSLLICEPRVEGDQNITIKVGSHQAVFRWHVANLKSNQKPGESAGYVEGNSDAGLKIGFDRYIVEPGSSFGADCDIKITVLYEGKATADFTYKAGENRIGNISINPANKSQLLLSPAANGDENIFITCNGETEVFVWHTEHVERFKDQGSKDTLEKTESDKSEADKTAGADSAQKDKTDDKTGKDTKDENEAVSNSQNGKDSIKQPGETDKSEKPGTAADEVKPEDTAVSETDENDEAKETTDNNADTASTSEPSLAAETDEQEAVSNGVTAVTEIEDQSRNTYADSEADKADTVSEPTGFLDKAASAFSAFVEWLKMMIERLIF